LTLVSVAVPLARQAIGGWLPMAAVLSVLGLLTMIPVCFTAKERIEVRSLNQDVGLKDMFRFIFSNKYMLIFYGAFLIVKVPDIAGLLNMYAARHILGSESLMSIIALATALPGLLIAFVLPGLCRRFDKFTIFFWSVIASGIINVASWFAGYANYPLAFVFVLLRAIPAGFVGLLMFMFTPDCVEYGIYKTGVSASGLAFSIQTFTAKLQVALTATVGALGLSLIGFVEGEGAAQLPGFADKLFFLYMIVPAAGCFLAIPLLRRYKLRDRDVQVMAKYNTGEISREEAESQLAAQLASQL
jgi:Na+/melibiose symporter-like transporter